jgi:hypothetical protein
MISYAPLDGCSWLSIWDLKPKPIRVRVEVGDAVNAESRTAPVRGTEAINL